MKINMFPNIDLPRVVIIGGGFAGLKLAKNLKKKDVQVVLIDRNNYHTFQPLLYQVSTAGLEPDSIVYPIRKVFKNHQNFYFRIAKAKSIDAGRNVLNTNLGEIEYDYLVIATGSKTNYFGLKDVEALSMSMKSVVEALNLRSLILQNFEEALTTNNNQEKERLMNYVIVGGGPTGIELAGALAELKKHVLPNDYPDLDIRKMHIHLVETDSRLINAMSIESSIKVLKFLKNLGVNVWLNTQVTGYNGNEVSTNIGKNIQAKTLVWAAGVKGDPIDGLNGLVVNKANRITVDEFNRVKGYDNIFALGDVAAMTSEKYSQGHPMLASVAIQQGALLAKNIIRLVKGKNMMPFKYRDKGMMATIGRNRAIAEFSKIRLHGTAAWFAWMFIHLVLLVGYRNKLVAFVNWAWSYFNYDKGIRLIIRPYKRKKWKPEKSIPSKMRV